MAKLTVEDKIKIINLYKDGLGNRTIAREMKITRSRVEEILRKYDLYAM